MPAAGFYTIFHQKHVSSYSKPFQSYVEGPPVDDGKLWLTVKNVMAGDKPNNFYLQGGEHIKLGRVVLKIVEVNCVQIQEAEDDNTQMSFAEINEDLVPGILLQEISNLESNVMINRQVSEEQKSPDFRSPDRRHAIYDCTQPTPIHNSTDEMPDLVITPEED